MAWLPFITTLMPELIGLARDLFKAFDGNANKARLQVRHLRQYGERYDRQRAQTDAQLDAIFPKGRKP